MQYLFGFIFAFFLGILSFDLFVFTDFFYKYYFQFHGTHYLNGISFSDLMILVSNIQSYLNGNAVMLVFSFISKNFFSSKDISHMVDVRNLFYKFHVLRDIVFLIIVSMCLIFFLKGFSLNSIKMSLKKILIGFFGFIVFYVILNLVLFFDFENSFIVFHKIFFIGNSWILPVGENRLTSIFTFDFFEKFYISFFLFYVFISFSLGIGLIFRLKKNNK